MRVHLVDGTYELFRAHYSKRPPHAGPDGEDAKATVGVVWSLLFLLHELKESVTHVAVAFDNPITSFRNQLYPEYKSDEGVPPELRRQFDAVEDAVRALGVVVWSMEEYEADDALAAGAARWADQVDQVRILTPDKDLGQSVRGTRVVQVDRLRQKETDETALRALRGIGPESIPDWLALTGDSADGFPGLPGFGEKSSATLLSCYPHLEDIPPRADQWTVKPRGAERLAATFAAHRDEAFLYRRLATLVTDVPLAETLDDLRWEGVPRDTFQAWCNRMGAGDLEARSWKWKT